MSLIEIDNWAFALIPERTSTDPQRIVAILGTNTTTGEFIATERVIGYEHKGKVITTERGIKYTLGKVGEDCYDQYNKHPTEALCKAITKFTPRVPV